MFAMSLIYIFNIALMFEIGLRPRGSILSGFEQPTSGEIFLDGKSLKLPPNGAAEALGIVIIHQEFNLADHLTVSESLFLGREVTRFGMLDRKAMRAETRRVLDRSL